MTAVAVTERIQITDTTIEQARTTPVERGASLVLRTAEGLEVELPASIQSTLLQTLTAIATTGSVTIGQVPDELTSTVAADLLGVSRPTLMKWAREGVIASHAVGTHTRFHRDDVLSLRNRRRAEQQAALTALREFDMEHEDLLDD